jgi:hypothetical protein
MVKHAHRASLALEAVETLGRMRESLRQDFDGDLAIQTGVAGPIDLPHTSRAEEIDDLVGTQVGATGQWQGGPPSMIRERSLYGGRTRPFRASRLRKKA